MLKFAAITPHPPIIIPEIGSGELARCKKTVEGMKKLAKECKASKIDRSFIVSPHSTMDYDNFLINTSKTFDGDFSEFGYPEIRLSPKGCGEIWRKYLNVIPYKKDTLDHGVMVPLYYLNTIHRIAPLSFCEQDLKQHFKFGQEIREAIDSTPKSIGFIASGDLSHRVTREAPAGYSPKGKKFDLLLMKLLAEKNTAGVLNIDGKLIAEIGECGLRSIAILLGVLSKSSYSPEILSYEAPFGVGYGVVNYKL